MMTTSMGYAMLIGKFSQVFYKFIFCNFFDILIFATKIRRRKFTRSLMTDFGFTVEPRV